MKRIAAVVSIMMLTSGCTTFDAYTGEEKTSKTAIGAGIGASVGAVVAYATNKDDVQELREERRLF